MLARSAPGKNKHPSDEGNRLRLLGHRPFYLAAIACKQARNNSTTISGALFRRHRVENASLIVLSRALATARVGKCDHSDQSKAEEHPSGGLGNGSEIQRPTAGDTAGIYSGVIHDVERPRTVWIGSVEYGERTGGGERGRRRRRKGVGRPDIGGLECAGNQRAIIQQGERGGIVQCNIIGLSCEVGPPTDIGKDYCRLALRTDQKHIDVVGEGMRDSSESESQVGDVAQSGYRDVGRIWCCHCIVVNRDQRRIGERLREERRGRGQENQRQQYETPRESNFHRGVSYGRTKYYNMFSHVGKDVDVFIF
jgi:hypothetical protein